MMGSGPSLHDLDLERLATEIVFGVNGTHLASDLAIPPYTFYGVIENEAVERYGLGPGKVVHTLPTVSTGWHLFPKQAASAESFTEAFIKRERQVEPTTLVTSRSVCITMLQVVLWLGFTEVYLIGCENSGKGQVHSSGRGHNDEWASLVSQQAQSATNVFASLGRSLENVSEAPTRFKQLLL
jgi:hypothetical protein